MAIEIVDFPSYKMVIFHSYVKLPEGISYHAESCSYDNIIQYMLHTEIQTYRHTYLPIYLFIDLSIY